MRLREQIWVTQRVEIVASYGERRDTVDQRLIRLLYALGYLPLAAPNAPEIVEAICLELQPAGILLSGGNSLLEYGGDAPERDETEKILLDWAATKKIPVLGICRGMQFMAVYGGGQLEQAEGHVATRHSISGSINRPSVNSYHAWSIKKLPPKFKTLATAPDGTIESLAHTELPWLGIGWHPEREKPFVEDDLELIQQCFKISG